MAVPSESLLPSEPLLQSSKCSAGGVGGHQSRAPNPSLPVFDNKTPVFLLLLPLVVAVAAFALHQQS